MPNDARPIGCQARPWLQAKGQEAFIAQLPTVMREIARIGYTGFETALACLPLDDPARFAWDREAADGIVLTGAHAGGKWWEPAAAETIPLIAARAAMLPALGCTRLVVSGAGIPTPVTDGDLATFTRTLAQLGQACRAVGVHIVYHNHAAEALNDARVLAAIVERCAPEEVMLGPDLGWIAHAGMHVEAFLARFGARIAYLHVRDVTAYGTDGGFIEIGCGILDHRAIIAALDALGYAGWLTVESEFNAYWRGLTDPTETATAQFQGLQAAGAA
ncbi:MAG: sugar phosphate isomerase/epimerase family protein [Thermomicrobiales bacterium]